jgi:hypothetical protein
MLKKSGSWTPKGACWRFGAGLAVMFAATALGQDLHRGELQYLEAGASLEADAARVNPPATTAGEPDPLQFQAVSGFTFRISLPRFPSEGSLAAGRANSSTALALRLFDNDRDGVPRTPRAGSCGPAGSRTWIRICERRATFALPSASRSQTL